MKPIEELLRDAAPGKAVEVRCRHCDDRVLLITAERSDAMPYLAVHLTKEHQVDMFIVQGRDFTIGPAPHRCDLCFAVVEPPWWTYITGPEARAADPEWLVCDVCHEIIVGSVDPLEQLVDRSYAVQIATLILDGVPADELREHMRTTIGVLVRYRIGEPVRSST